MIMMMTRSNEIAKKQEAAEWRIIHEHSMAKISKSLAEEYYAPKPLPPALSKNLNDRIESSRSQLIRILREQNDLYSNKSFAIY